MRELLSTLLGNRELLLACVLSGKRAFCNECRQAFAGMAVGEIEIERIWAFIESKKGPTPEYDYEWLIAQREQQEAALKAEADALLELEQKAHGKDAQAEIGKWGTFH